MTPSGVRDPVIRQPRHAGVCSALGRRRAGGCRRATATASRAGGLDVRLDVHLNLDRQLDDGLDRQLDDGLDRRLDDGRRLTNRWLVVVHERGDETSRDGLAHRRRLDDGRLLTAATTPRAPAPVLTPTRASAAA